MKTVKKLLSFLTPVERRRAGLLIVMIMVMALMDTLGVASIMPFIAVLNSPEFVETNQGLKAAYSISRSFGFATTDQFLFLLGMLFFGLLVFLLAFKALTTYALTSFALMCEFSISKRLVEGFIRQPYSWFLSRHSADLGKAVLSEVDTIINNGIRPTLNIVAQGMVVFALLTLLVLVDVKLAIIVALTLGLSIAFILLATRGLLNRMGAERLMANQERFKIVSEGFGACKEIKVGGLEKAFVQRFSEPARTYARKKASAQVIGQLPRFALEAIAFGGMLLVVLYLLAQGGGLDGVLPIVALYAFAGYRLMPALQQIYSAATQLRFVGPAIDALHADLMSLQPLYPERSQESITFEKVLALDHVCYRYPNALKPALTNLSIHIPARSTVGLIGTTGSGKTTTVDVILGLLVAQEGTLQIDDTVINDNNRRGWQAAIGYVPQQIYLADDTVASNIAFGFDVKDIDQTAMVRAAKIANLHEFVINELPHQYQTKVGERGVRLSGGQRQRIGIARALYHNPKVLILDEATSALDNYTERAVMEAVYNLGREITIIIIAHRLSTVKHCDNIFLLERGQVKAQGTFHDLAENDSQFKFMLGYE